MRLVMGQHLRHGDCFDSRHRGRSLRAAVAMARQPGREAGYLDANAVHGRGSGRFTGLGHSDPAANYKHLSRAGADLHSCPTQLLRSAEPKL